MEGAKQKYAEGVKDVLDIEKPMIRMRKKRMNMMSMMMVLMLRSVQAQNFETWVSLWDRRDGDDDDDDDDEHEHAHEITAKHEE